MPLRNLLVFLYIVFLCIGAQAQTDSLYMQQWGRDAVTNFNSTTSSQRQIITKETIRNSGYTKVSDLLQLLDAWTFSTIAGDQWKLQSNGTGNYENQSWILMLNGQRIEPKESLTNDINALGVNIWDIERIEVINTIGLFLGEYASGGIIQIVTQKGSKEGLYVRGSYSYGMSTIASQRSTENQSTYNNQDGGSTTIGFTQHKHHVAGSLNYSYFTNQDSMLPITYIYAASPYQKSLTASRLEYQFSGKKLQHQLQFIYSDYDQPNTSPSRNLSYLGLYTINSNHQIRLSVSQNTKGSNSYSNNLLQYRYFKPYKKGNFIWQTGLTYTTSDYTFNYLKPNTSITLPVTRKTTIWAETQLALANQNVHPKYTIGLYKRVSFISNYSLILSYGTVENEVMNYIPFKMGKSTIGNPAYPMAYSSNQATADFYYNIGFGNNVKFSFNSGIKYADNLASTEFLILTFPNEPPIADKVTNLNTYQTNWINRLNVHYDIIRNLAIDLNYMRTGTVNTWNEELRYIPKHKFTFIARYNFPKKLTLWVRNYWQSETNWWNEPELMGDAPTNTGNLYQTLPAIYTWDAGLTKKLFKDFLRINLTACNLLNANERYAPQGAQFDARFVTSITANIDGIFAKSTPKP